MNIPLIHAQMRFLATYMAARQYRAPEPAR